MSLFMIEIANVPGFSMRDLPNIVRIWNALAALAVNLHDVEQSDQACLDG